MRIVSLIAVAGTLWASLASYQIQPGDGQRMELIVEKTGLLSGKKHLFTFSQYQGTLQFDPAAPEESKVMLSIDSRSALCRDTWLSAKDLVKVQQYALTDMLAAEKYPNITFRSSAVKKLEGERYEVHGTLTIRDVQKPTVVLVTASPGSLSFQGSAKIKLTDFNLKPPKAALGAIGAKDEMSFSFVLKAEAGKPASY